MNEHNFLVLLIHASPDLFFALLTNLLVYTEIHMGGSLKEHRVTIGEQVLWCSDLPQPEAEEEEEEEELEPDAMERMRNELTEAYEDQNSKVESVQAGVRFDALLCCVIFLYIKD